MMAKAAALLGMGSFRQGTLASPVHSRCLHQTQLCTVASSPQWILVPVTNIIFAGDSRVGQAGQPPKRGAVLQLVV